MDITLKKAYEELTDRSAPLYGAHSLFYLANNFIGLNIIDCRPLHLRKKIIEKWWQLFYALRRDTVIIQCEDKNKNSRYYQAVDFFLLVINFLELTYHRYYRWYYPFILKTINYHQWINDFQTFYHQEQEINFFAKKVKKEHF